MYVPAPYPPHVPSHSFSPLIEFPRIFDTFPAPTLDPVDTLSDVQSLHNRLLVVEGTLAQLSAAPPSTPIASAFSNLPPFKSSYPSQSIAAAQAAQGAPPHSTSSCSTLPGLPCNDRALLATGASGSSVVINLEDVASIWLKELDLAPNGDALQTHGQSLATSAPYTGTSLPNPTNAGKSKVKLEPTPVVLSPPSPALSSSSVSTLSSSSYPGGQAPLFIPPLPYNTFLPSSSNSPAAPTPSSHSASTLHSSPPSSHSHYPPSHHPFQNELPQVTPALLAHLPVPAHRARLMQAFSETMVLHPCFNVRHFERRVDAMIAWAESGASFNPNAGEAGENKRRDLAREIFGLSGSTKKPNTTGSASPKPTLSFFAAAAAAFALGALVARDNGESSSSNPVDGHIGAGHSPSSSGSSTEGSNPAALYALSDQALDLFEKTSPYDVDSVVAMILQVLFRLHEDRTHISQAVFPLVSRSGSEAPPSGQST